EGSDKAAAALDRLGIPVQQFIGLKPEEQLQLVAERIGSIEDPAQRAATAIGLLGRGGAEQLPVLVELGKNAAELKARFDQLGGPVAEGVIQRIDDMGDAFAMLKLQTKSLGTEITDLVSVPGKAFLDWAAEAVGFIRTQLGSGIVGLSNDIDRLR